MLDTLFSVIRGDLGSKESTREEIWCGGNEDVIMDEWSHQAGQNLESKN